MGVSGDLLGKTSDGRKRPETESGRLQRNSLVSANYGAKPTPPLCKRTPFCKETGQCEMNRRVLQGNGHRSAGIFGQQCRQTRRSASPFGIPRQITEKTTTLSRPQFGHRGLVRTASAGPFALTSDSERSPWDDAFDIVAPSSMGRY